MHMRDLFTIGLGASLLMMDKAEAVMDRLLERGDQGRDQARSLRDRAEVRLDRHMARCEARCKDAARAMAHDLGLATREDVEAAVRAKD